MKILPTIHAPSDLKKIPNEQLPELCQEIREEILTVTSKNGGHLAPNLGVVELTVALHKVLVCISTVLILACCNRSSISVSSFFCFSAE